MTDGFVFKRLDNILQEEWGSNTGVRFLDPKHVKLYDSDNKEVEIPKCETCGQYKSQLVGRKSFIWVCSCNGAA